MSTNGTSIFSKSVNCVISPVSLDWDAAVWLLSESIGALSALHALRGVRTSQGTIAWCIALITFPFVAVPLYWVLGRSRFDEYREKMREVWSSSDGLIREFRDALSKYRCDQLGQEEKLTMLNHLTSFRFTRGNQVGLLIDGDATYAAMLEAISSAKDYILFEIYILRDDRTGRQFQAQLIERAQAGVRVYLLYDAMGSYFLGRRYVRELQVAGVEVAAFAAIRRWKYPFQLNFRNHRKVLVVDGREVFVGGLNVGDEYRGEDRGLSPWRDAHLRIRGPAVQSAQMIFLHDWYWARRDYPDNLLWAPSRCADHGHDLLMLPCGPTDPWEVCTIFFVEAIGLARKRFWITTPYFVPDPSVINALAMAVLRGVDVRIVLSYAADQLVVHLAGFYFLRIMQEIGVKMYRQRRGFLHKKAFVVDDDYAYVGTANLDNRSFRLNFELCVLVADQRFAAEVATMLEHDLADAHATGPEELARQWFGFRFGVRLARLFEPIL